MPKARDRKPEGSAVQQDVKNAFLLVFGLFVLMLVLAKITSSDIAMALAHTKTFVGILVTITGAGGSLLALRGEAADGAERLVRTMPGVVGILAGATLLEVGGWASPAALGAAGISTVVAYGILKKA